ncbi:MAG TPA: hypothetical protein V6D48_14910 [Oculatellaceae cyanobacterium]
MKKAQRSHFTKDQKAIAPPLLLENHAFGFVVVGCDRIIPFLGVITEHLSNLRRQFE